MRRAACFILFLASIIAVTSVSGQPKEGAEEKKKESLKWEYPKEIAGKNLAAWVRDMREHKDASMRELAIRTVPAFGPDARKAASVNLLHALTADPDFAVRMSALSTVPVLGFDEKETKIGIKAMIDMTRSTQLQSRFDAITALGNCGWVAKDAIPTLVDYALLDPQSWQIRRAAAIALGKLGYDETEGPDNKAVSGLIRCLLNESAVQVRREAVQAVLLLGIPTEKQTWVDLRKALNERKRDIDKSIGIWARVCLMRLEEKRVTDKDQNALDLVAFLSSSDMAIRVEALQGIGTMGSELAFTIPDVKRVVDTDKETFVAGTAIWTLTSMTSHILEITPYLEQVKKSHKEESIRKTAEEALKYIVELKKEETKKDPKKEAIPKKEIPKKKDVFGKEEKDKKDKDKKS